MKPIKEVIAEVLTTLQQRIKWLEVSHQTIINNLLEIVPKLEKYKEYKDISISITGSIYIYLEHLLIVFYHHSFFIAPFDFWHRKRALKFAVSMLWYNLI